MRVEESCGEAPNVEIFEGWEGNPADVRLSPYRQANLELQGLSLRVPAA